MDGSNRKILVVSNVVWPTGLAIDYAARNLYWTDPKQGTVKMISLQDEHTENVYVFPKGLFCLLFFLFASSCLFLISIFLMSVYLN